MALPEGFVGVLYGYLDQPQPSPQKSRSPTSLAWIIRLTCAAQESEALTPSSGAEQVAGVTYPVDQHHLALNVLLAMYLLVGILESCAFT